MVVIPQENRQSARPKFGHNVIEMLEVVADLAALCRRGTIVAINTAGLRFFGSNARDALIGQAFTDYVAPDYVDIVRELLAVDMIETAPIPVLLSRLDGTQFDVSLRIHPARELGQGYAVIIGRDISHEGRLAKAALENAHRFQLVVEKSMHLICQCQGPEIVYMNAAGIKMLRADDTIKNQHWLIPDIFHTPYREMFQEDINLLLDEDAILPVRLVALDGSLIDAQVFATRLSSIGTSPVFMLEARDITAHNRAVVALRLFNETLEQQVLARTHELDQEKLFVESLLESVPNPLWWCDVEGCLLGYNEAFRAWHNITDDSLIGQQLSEIETEQSMGSAANAEEDALSGSHVVYETNFHRHGFGLRNVMVSKTAWQDTNGKTIGVINVMMDITERKTMEAELRTMATRDGLTGCFNRQHLVTLIAAEFERSKRFDRPLVVLMLDIDHFKRINDTYGHPVGDEAIKAFAMVCAGLIRPQDALGRVGGEEFVIVLPEMRLPGAMLLGERLRTAIACIVVPSVSGMVTFTASIGVAELLPSDTSMEMLVSRADVAMYRAKQMGRNRVVAAEEESPKGEMP